MIIITGAAGFIGSCLVSHFNKKGITDLILVDDFSIKIKENNYNTKSFIEKIERSLFIDWLQKNEENIEVIFHLGARTDTTEKDWDLLLELNLNYSKSIWTFCAAKQIPLVYASSAATYGDGSLGFDDRHDIINKLEPLNHYGKSKNDFDIWALKQSSAPPAWYGLKFFNVYGPNEYHKNRMASVIFHCFNKVNLTNEMGLFKSHHPDFKDGEQQRDFIYVKDLTQICEFMYTAQPKSGLYNVGTGKARTFYDLAKATFESMDKPVNIKFINIPEDLKGKYQYFTEANMQKLIDAGYDNRFYSLEEGISDYVKNYLIPGKFE